MGEYIAGLDLSPYIEGEIWKDIPGCEGYYQVSNIGRVRSLDRFIIDCFGRKIFKQGKILKQYRRGKGMRFSVILSKNGCHTKEPHRLVAEAFIPNPDSLPIVNHKDENCLHNYVDNLEWCTQKYNMNYGTCRQRISASNSIPVIQLSMDDKILKIWDSCSKAGEAVTDKEKYKHHNAGTKIIRCCKNKQKYAYGYKWKYLLEYEPKLTEEEILYYKTADPPKLILKRQHDRNVIQLSTSFDFINQYSSTELVDTFGKHKKQAILSCCRNRQKTAYGYKWMYLEDYEKLLENNRNNT